jgi:hypothetical protein
VPILQGGQRRYLFGKSLSYLFSYDVSLAEDVRLPVVGGVRFWSEGSGNRRGGPARPADERESQQVYHVVDEERVLDNDALTGRIRWCQNTVFVPYSESVGDVEGILLMETPDGGLIEGRYKGSLVLGPLGVRHFDAGSGGLLEGSVPRRTRARMFIAPRFDTGHPKYKWITRFQCAGFGVLEIEDGEMTDATFDIYVVGAGKAAGTQD